MANATFKKSIVIVIFTLLYSLDSFSQKTQKIKQFSNEFSAYLIELNGFMNATDNDELESLYKRFLKISEKLSEKEKRSIIKISNTMLSKRLRPNHQFEKFLLE